MKNDCVKRNFLSMDSHLHHPNSQERIKILKRFIGKVKPNIDVGCGAFMPLVLGTTHACDYNMVAKGYLKSLKWKGEFKVGDLRKKLPYTDKQFKVAVCSEVIEHLKTKKQVLNAFLEIDRISESWIVTTPSVYIADKDHKLFFCSGNLFNFIPFGRQYFVVINKGPYFYISNNLKKLERILL